MLEKLLEYLSEKRILILGVGIEGKSTYDFLRRNFPEKQLFIADKSTNLLEKYPEFMEDIYLELNMGENYLNAVDEYDLIIKTPGISFKGMDISKFEEKITNQLQLLLEFVDVYTIGITGTKGKSTTSSLIYSVLKEQDKNVLLLGNIGDPIFDNIENLKNDSIVVLELSSHELQFVKKSPNISILLNIYEEHLDFYESMEKYIEAKFNIVKYREKDDIFIYNFDNENIKKYNKYAKPKDYAITLEKKSSLQNAIYIDGENICYNEKVLMDINHKMNLKGMHNINNIMFVFAVCDILKLNLDNAIETISNFKPLEHRMEFVGTVEGIDFYNDSIATIPEATINTIKALKNVNSIIIGGKDRGVNLDSVIEFIEKSNIENVICLPKTGEFIFEKLKDKKNAYMVQNLQEAVEIAKKVTQKGCDCVLSPAASSYGYFKNFKERGNIFKSLVLKDNIKKVQNNDLT